MPPLPAVESDEGACNEVLTHGSGMDLVTTTRGPQLLEKGQAVDVIVEAVDGRDGGCLISMAEAIILSVAGEPPSREVCVSYPSWRPDLHIALVSAQQ